MRAASPWSAVAIGLSAHALAAGCLPQLLPMLLVLPFTLLAVRASDTYFARRSLLLRATAGQVVVHVAVSVATSCATHPAAAPQQHHVQPALDVAITGAHIVALILMMTVAARLERNIVTALTSAAMWVRALLERCEQPQCVPAARGAVCHRRAGFVPAELVHRRCGITRGPPAWTGCPIVA
jgi:hypothetical protein